MLEVVRILCTFGVSIQGGPVSHKNSRDSKTLHVRINHLLQNFRIQLSLAPLQICRKYYLHKTKYDIDILSQKHKNSNRDVQTFFFCEIPKPNECNWTTDNLYPFCKISFEYQNWPNLYSGQSPPFGFHFCFNPIVLQNSVCERWKTAGVHSNVTLGEWFWAT